VTFDPYVKFYLVSQAKTGQFGRRSFELIKNHLQTQRNYYSLILMTAGLTITPPIPHPHVFREIF